MYTGGQVPTQATKERHEIQIVKHTRGLHPVLRHRLRVRPGSGPADAKARRRDLCLRRQELQFQLRHRPHPGGGRAHRQRAQPDRLARDPPGREEAHCAAGPFPHRYRAASRPHDRPFRLFPSRGRRRGRRRGRLDALARARRPGAHPEARGRVARDARGARRLPLRHAAHRVPPEDGAQGGGKNVRADAPERRPQRVGHRRMAAEGAGAVLRGRDGRRPDQQPPADRVDSRHPRRREADEGPEPGARGSRHGEDLRGQRKILRAAPRARRQAGKRRQVARPDQEGSAHARVRKLGRAGALPDQRRSGLPGRERRLSACSSPRGNVDTAPAEGGSYRRSCSEERQKKTKEVSAMPSPGIPAVSRFSSSPVYAFALALALAAGPVQAAGNKLEVVRHERVAGELLVKFRADVNEQGAQAILREHTGGGHEAKRFKAPRKVSHAAIGRWWHVKLPPGQSGKTVLPRLARHPKVEAAEPNYIVKAVATPDDPRYPEQWSLNNIGQTGGTPGADIDAPEAWDRVTGSSGIVVAVIDTGVDYTHPDLAANIWTNPGEIPGNGIDDDGNGYVDDVHGFDFCNNDNDPMDDHGHGTHVSGTIAAVGNNGIGVAGVNWSAQIMPVKFLGPGGSGYTSDAIRAVLYATDMGARVLNNSWGGGGYSEALRDAVVAAYEANVLFVAAAGNSSNNADVVPLYPAAYDVPNVISVAATDHYDGLAYFSNYGPNSVHLGAPGVNILSTVSATGDPCCSDASGYKLLSGTSMATPHVAGSAALLLAQDASRSAIGLKSLLLDTVNPVPSLAGITVTGGRL